MFPLQSTMFPLRSAMLPLRSIAPRLSTAFLVKTRSPLAQISIGARGAYPWRRGLSTSPTLSYPRSRPHGDTRTEIHNVTPREPTSERSSEQTKPQSLLVRGTTLTIHVLIFLLAAKFSREALAKYGRKSEPEELDKQQPDPEEATITKKLAALYWRQ